MQTTHAGLRGQKAPDIGMPKDPIKALHDRVSLYNAHRSEPREKRPVVLATPGVDLVQGGILRDTAMEHFLSQS